MSKPSEACCNIPPIVDSGYKEKGQYITLDGMKTYVSGPDNAPSGLLLIYDIFGYFPQTLQGADILGNSDTENRFKTFMPDWFGNEAADISWFPPQTDDHKQKLGNFFQTKAAPPDKLEKIPKLIADAKSKYPSIKKWGILGYCWGGKVATLACANTDTFSAGAKVHPAMVDANDAKNVKIPFLVLASGDEPEEDVKKFGDNLTGKKHVETYSDQVHGWMAARADLKDPKVKAEYERGYKTVLQFFQEHM